MLIANCSGTPTLKRELCEQYLSSKDRPLVSSNLGNVVSKENIPVVHCYRGGLQENHRFSHSTEIVELCNRVQNQQLRGVQSCNFWLWGNALAEVCASLRATAWTLNSCSRARMAAGSRDAHLERVFVTGGQGFLGAYVLRSKIEKPERPHMHRIVLP
eukprot:1151928-Amphidinium_carterae.1